jgi:5'-methylthioadenosine phosphorylase
MGQAKIAVIGGSGFYKLLENPQFERRETPYGAPSAKIALGKIGKQEVAFLPRHGYEHELNPRMVPYKANLWALKSLGVERVIALTACGSLQKKIKRGDFVVVDQFVDRTRYRDDTYFSGPITTHVSTAYPYCPEISRLAFSVGKELSSQKDWPFSGNIRIHPKGTLVVIEGPRFSTRAESEWFTKMGWDIVNMTGYPEVTLARELELCYCAIALVTDYDVGIVAREKLAPVKTEEVLKVFKDNNEKAQKLVIEIIKRIPEKRKCQCGKALTGARI